MSVSRVGCSSRVFHIPNEDSKDCVQGEALAGLVVADGVGSSWHGEIASQVAAQGFIEALANATSVQDIDFPALFTQLANQVRESAEDTPGRPDGEWPATTLLSATYDKRTNKLVLAYVGDGAILVVRGDRKYGFSVLLPTNSREGGLKHILDPQAPSDVLPVVLEITGLSSWVGGCFVIVATDGVPLDNKSIVRGLIDHLHRAFRENPARFTDKTLSDALDKWLCEQPVDDDATIGVLLTPDTIALWESESC